MSEVILAAIRRAKELATTTTEPVACYHSAHPFSGEVINYSVGTKRRQSADVHLRKHNIVKKVTFYSRKLRDFSTISIDSKRYSAVVGINIAGFLTALRRAGYRVKPGSKKRIYESFTIYRGKKYAGAFVHDIPRGRMGAWFHFGLTEREAEPLVRLFFSNLPQALQKPRLALPQKT